MSRELYDEICRDLTDYENPQDCKDWFKTDWKAEFYKLLVKVVNESDFA